MAGRRGRRKQGSDAARRQHCEDGLDSALEALDHHLASTKQRPEGNATAASTNPTAPWISGAAQWTPVMTDSPGAGAPPNALSTFS